MSAGKRAGVCALLGVLVLGATVWLLPIPAAIVAGWDVTAIAIVALSWSAALPLDARGVERRATREDSSRPATELLLVSSAVASLVGVALVLIEAGTRDGLAKFVFTALGVLTVAVSWALVHTMFALRYAHEYYSSPVGGIDFKSDERPDYHDFAYVAFTIGMTFQVSDTDIQQRRIRRTALRHALLAYLFGAVIVAVTINVVASFFQ